MTEEEKKAIEYLTLIVKKHDLKKKGYVYTEEAIETVLNLIQKQQVEKEQLKAELEKKDKIIYLMAFDIYGMQMECNRYFKDTEEVKQYFEKKVEESNI